MRLATMLLALMIGPVSVISGVAVSQDIPRDLTCPIEERREAIGESITVEHRCYGIRGHAVVHIAEVDLIDPELEFVTTPSASHGDREFTGQTTSDFAKESRALLAINAGYFEPFNSGTHGEPAYPQKGDPVNVMGQHIRDGVVISDNAIDIPRFRLRVGGAFCSTWNSARIVEGTCPQGTHQAVGAGPLLMVDGQTPSFHKFDARFAIKRAPRALLALNQDRSTLWFIVVDGRQADDYSLGMNLPELADLLRGLGAWDALNLDGGGSAVLVGPEGRVLSQPIQGRVSGRERVVANHLGVVENRGRGISAEN